ncbi:MAG: twin-arginine translocation signal domain-containing protein [Candidatus Korarchaeota archaeon]|nr:twin-arginine translocation signal domain-containing protein [Candidatus Korarchaeota archaeon]
MKHREGGSLASISLTRRDFLKLSAAASLLLADFQKLQKAAAETLKQGSVNLIWFESQDCAGNTISMIEGSAPDLIQVLVGENPAIGPGKVRVVFHETIMPEWGEAAIEYLHKAEAGELDPYVLVLEGSFPDEDAAAKTGGWWFVLGEEDGRPITGNEWVRRLLKRAVAVVAVGNCACYGGIVASQVLDSTSYSADGWSPTGAFGFFDDPLKGIKGAVSRWPEARPFLNFIEGKGKLEVSPTGEARPAVAIPGCPANGNAILRVLGHLILAVDGLLPLPELDEYWRPVYIFGRTTHEQCPRAGFYAAGDFRENPGDNDFKCLFQVGCKGPVSNCPWNRVGWIDGIGGPTRTGGVCIGCTMPGFPDRFEPFYKPLQAPSMPDTVTLTGITAGAAAVGLAAGYIMSEPARKGGKGEKEGGGG